MTSQDSPCCAAAVVLHTSGTFPFTKAALWSCVTNDFREYPIRPAALAYLTLSQSVALLQGVPEFPGSGEFRESQVYNAF